MEPLPGHLLAIPFHDPLQKVRGFVWRLTTFWKEFATKMIEEIKILSIKKESLEFTE
jgi:hypothetical protein